VGRHNGILLTGNNNKIYGHFTSDDEAGPFQWGSAQPPFFSSLKLNPPPSAQGPRKGLSLLKIQFGAIEGQRASIRRLRPSLHLPFGIVRGEIREHADAPHALALLRPRPQPATPRRHRAA
jgi:hypothetical protein